MLMMPCCLKGHSYDCALGCIEVTLLQGAWSINKCGMKQMHLRIIAYGHAVRKQNCRRADYRISDRIFTTINE